MINAAKIAGLMPPGIKGLGYRFVFRKRKILEPGPFIKTVSGKCGLEIGGPSVFFQFSLPLYHHASSIDGVNFSQETMWEGSIASGKPFQYMKNHAGRQIIAEAVDLAVIEDVSYDFILSCHSLEHVANPLKALLEWNRVLKPGGTLILVVPNKESIFDHRRPVTTFAHLVSDFDLNTGESDLTHLPEILELHDLKRDRAAGTHTEFRERSMKNFENRGLHHHVFDLQTLTEAVNFAHFEIQHSGSSYYDHFVLCTKA